MDEPHSICAIGGLDATGGAGLLADTAAILAMGGRASAVVTAVTAQFDDGGLHARSMPLHMLEAQWRSVTQVFMPSALKVGMLGTKEAVEFVCEIISQFEGRVVCDPVLKASSGASLFDGKALAVLKSAFLPKVDLVTPNLHESATLLGLDVPENEIDMEEHLLAWRDLGAKNILLKGGHLVGDELVDLLLYTDELGETHIERFWGTRIDTSMARGTGCRLASAVATEWAKNSTNEYTKIDTRLKGAVMAARAHVRAYLLQGADK